MKIGEKNIGEGFPVYIIAEIGLNHNGDLETAKKLIDVACNAGVDAVKFKKNSRFGGSHGSERYKEILHGAQ